MARNKNKVQEEPVEVTIPSPEAEEVVSSTSKVMEEEFVSSDTVEKTVEEVIDNPKTSYDEPRQVVEEQLEETKTEEKIQETKKEVVVSTPTTSPTRPFSGICYWF